MTTEARRRAFPRGSFVSVMLLVTVGLSSCVSAGSATRQATRQRQTPQAIRTTERTPSATPIPPVAPVLPGQQIWKDGVSSLLFGTNDSDEYSDNNLDTQPLFQHDLKTAGVTLIRTFLQDPSSDSALDQRMATIEQIGATCLAVLPNIDDLAFNEHAVSYLGDRCLMYDFGNEPDWNNISVDTYSKAWITEIPQLRKLNPHALFFGPVVSYPHTPFLREFLTQAKAANVLPDGISVHWYACYQDPEDICAKRESLLAANLVDIQQSVRGVLGKDLPIGIDEYNFDPSGPGPAYGNDPAFVSTFYTTIMAQLIQAHVVYACQFDAASYAGYGTLDMFDVKTNQPKPPYYALTNLIAQYKPTT